MLAVLFAASVISHPAVAKADEVMEPPRPVSKQLSVVQLGDSFSAGNGAGSYYGAAWCERSSKNWGQRFVESASSLGIDVTYVNRACSGGVLEDIFKPGTVEEQYLRIAEGDSEDDVRSRLEREDACSVKSSDDIIGVEYQISRLGGSSYFTYRCKLTLRPQADSVDKGTDLVLMTMGVMMQGSLMSSNTALLLLGCLNMVVKMGINAGAIFRVPLVICRRPWMQLRMPLSGFLLRRCPVILRPR